MAGEDGREVGAGVKGLALSDDGQAEEVGGVEAAERAAEGGSWAGRAAE